MLRSDPRRQADKALLLHFSVEINDVAETRQVDHYLDKLTQMKQAFAVFQGLTKTALEEGEKTVAGAALLAAKQPPSRKAPKKAPKKGSRKGSKTTPKAKAAKGKKKSKEDGGTYSDFVAWARANCGSLAAIKGKSEPDIKTNIRIADQLCMSNIRWMLTLDRADEAAGVGRGVHGTPQRPSRSYLFEL